MAVNSDNVTAKLRKLSKEDMIWCILEFEKRSFGWPSLGAILADLKCKKDVDNIDRCKMLSKKAHDKTMEYYALIKPYEGKPLAEVPNGVYERALMLLREAEAADKEWFRLSGIKEK